MTDTKEFKCTKCGEYKPEGAFHPSVVKKLRATTGRRNGFWWRSCLTAYYTKRRKDDPDYFNRFHKKSKIERRSKLHELKAQKACKECGEADARCLDFHHRDKASKTMNICEALIANVGWERILAELEKCDVICANCHRKHHASEYANGWGGSDPLKLIK